MLEALVVRRNPMPGQRSSIRGCSGLPVEFVVFVALAFAKPTT